MTELAKLYWQFWSQFTGEAYDRNAVSQSAKFPYITYDSIDNDIFNTGLQSVIVWTNPGVDSVTQLNEIRDAIRTAIPHEGTVLTLPDGSGAIKLSRGTPFSQPYPQEEAGIKAAYINVEIRSYTR